MGSSGIGDSLTWGFRMRGKDAFKEFLDKNWPSPLLLGISGDRTYNLLWRLTHGELPAHLATNSRALFSLLIGTNDLLCCKNDVLGTLAGILTVANFLLQNTRGKLLVNAILPRKEIMKDPWLGLGLRLNCVNALLREGVDQLAAAFPGRVGFIDCSAYFWVNVTHVRMNLMWDGIHPTEGGYRVLAQCLRDGLMQFLR